MNIKQLMSGLFALTICGCSTTQLKQHEIHNFTALPPLVIELSAPANVANSRKKQLLFTQLIAKEIQAISGVPKLQKKQIDPEKYSVMGEVTESQCSAIDQCTVTLNFINGEDVRSSSFYTTQSMRLPITFKTTSDKNVAAQITIPNNLTLSRKSRFLSPYSAHYLADESLNVVYSNLSTLSPTSFKKQLALQTKDNLAKQKQKQERERERERENIGKPKYNSKESTGAFSENVYMPKYIGAKVCSIDNHFGYVKQIKNNKIQIELAGKINNAPEHMFFNGQEADAIFEKLSHLIWADKNAWAACNFTTNR